MTAILNIRSMPATSDQNSNTKPLIRMVSEEQTDKYCKPDTSVSENKDTQLQKLENAAYLQQMALNVQ